ncbi:hypothetical protein [Streptomyces sp. WMMB 322]|uniref:hypothetical protein n=1 Tax=Streptomyces sp. WMMB 322 TaxID=1286821 RepID=UPI0006E3B2A3|nr:hypothetical protein [Streptomyces sp. WMMB 322]SCK27308.1 hypothetical protein H180DRAFT_02113 [Streptomyces sp. WMMB 322]
MQQVTRKILGVAVLGAALASAGTGVASADTPLRSVTNNPAKAVHEGDHAAGNVTGAVRHAKKNAMKKHAKPVTLDGPVSRTLDGPKRI